MDLMPAIVPVEDAVLGDLPVGDQLTFSIDKDLPEPRHVDLPVGRWLSGDLLDQVVIGRLAWNDVAFLGGLLALLAGLSLGRCRLRRRKGRGNILALEQRLEVCKLDGGAILDDNCGFKRPELEPLETPDFGLLERAPVDPIGLAVGPDVDLEFLACAADDERASPLTAA